MLESPGLGQLVHVSQLCPCDKGNQREEMTWARHAKNKIKTEYKPAYHKRSQFIRNFKNRSLKHYKYNKNKSIGLQNKIDKIKACCSS